MLSPFIKIFITLFVCIISIETADKLQSKERENDMDCVRKRKREREIVGTKTQNRRRTQ